jgi:hypothetical protein
MAVGQGMVCPCAWARAAGDQEVRRTRIVLVGVMGALHHLGGKEVKSCGQ